MSKESIRSHILQRTKPLVEQMIQNQSERKEKTLKLTNDIKIIATRTTKESMNHSPNNKTSSKTHL